MISIADLHPDDTAIRAGLTAALRQIREARCISGPRLGDILGIEKSRVSNREMGGWRRVSVVQAWARGLSYRVDLTIDDLTVPDDGDQLAVLYAAQQPASATDEDRLDLRILVNNLARIRRHQRVTLAEMGRRLGCSESAVCHRESRPDGMLFATAQRYTRVLGGVLGAKLIPAWSEGRS